MVNSPSRRKSIAVLDQNEPIRPKRPRRPHSVAPSELNPVAKSRLSFAGPIKSILKGSLNILRRDSNVSIPSSTQSLTDLPSSLPTEEHDSTRSMELTQDIQGTLHDNFTRKSMSRRVSFSDRTHIRLFRPPDDNTHSSAATSSPPSSDDDPKPPTISNENDYPRASISRRSSMGRPSMANTDMDLTTVIGGSDDQIFEENFDFEEDENATLDLPGHPHRLSSMARQPLSAVSYPRLSTDTGYDSHMSIDESSMDMTMSDASSDPSVVDFSIPFGRALNPAEEDPAWVALKNATHAGLDPSNQDKSIESDDEINEMLARMEHVRNSQNFATADESMSSMGSVSEEEQTVNLSRVYGRESIATTSRPSSGSAMDESVVYSVPFAQNSMPPQEQSTPRDTDLYEESESNLSLPQAHAPEPLRVFSLPEPKQPPQPKQSHPKPIQYSAAFAPPVSRPTPKKQSVPDNTSVASLSLLQKRPRPSAFDIKSDGHVQADQPSPAKRQSMARKWSDTLGPGQSESSVSPKKPKPLPPAKKAPFQAANSITKTASLRRPSGYFASRRSMSATPSTSAVPPPSSNKETSAKQKPSLGRASVGSSSSDAWQRFDKDIPSPSLYPSIRDLQKDNDVVMEDMSQRTNTPATRNSPPVVPVTDTTLWRMDQVPNETDEIVTNEMPDEVGTLGATEQWKEGLHQHEFIDENEVTVSVEQFLEMTGIKFMDELAAPRRSLHPSQLQSRQSRLPTDIPLAEYTLTAAIDGPELALYSRVSDDLEAWMTKSKEDYRFTEEEAAKMTPELFVEYCRADEEGQTELRAQLNLIKTNTRGLAKCDWYNWKLQWVEGLHTKAAQSLAALEADAKVLGEIKAQADQTIPVLELEYQTILADLEREQAEVSEIEQCDQEYLNELKASIAEQNLELESLKTEVSEGGNRIKWLQERVVETEQQKNEANTAIAQGHRILHMQKNSTRSEVFRLREELQAMESLHMFETLKVSPDVFEYLYSSQFRVVIPCRHFVPITEKIEVTQLPAFKLRVKDYFPQLSKFIFSTARERIRTSDHLSTTRQVIHTLADYWSAASQVRSQLRYLSVKYPVEIELDHLDTLQAKVAVLFPTQKAKVVISYIFSSDTFARWPMTVESLECNVGVVYGTIDQQQVYESVMSRLRQATAADHHACLLDACIEAQEVCQ